MPLTLQPRRNRGLRSSGLILRVGWTGLQPSCLAAIFLLTLSHSLFAQETTDMQTAQKFERRVTLKLSAKYLLFLPKEYKAKGSKRWPLILFLHGSGERGTNLAKVKLHGPPRLVQSHADFPFIVISPQCPEDAQWDEQLLLALLEKVIATYKVDSHRVYLTGLSMGGYGTWKLGLSHPERFAAIAPICGGGDPIDILLASNKRVETLKTLGVWAFHGGKDPVVHVEESERMISALRKAGCPDVKLTVYPEATHDSWTETYNNPELYDWFLKHERKTESVRRYSARGKE
jgi:predicted peptidase